jgi:hypothetical protein
MIFFYRKAVIHGAYYQRPFLGGHGVRFEKPSHYTKRLLELLRLQQRLNMRVNLMFLYEGLMLFYSEKYLV